jgi:hypothetical protein
MSAVKYQICGLCGDENLYRGLLGCDTVQFGRWLPTLRGNMFLLLRVEVTINMKAVYFSVTLIAMYQMTPSKCLIRIHIF